jgi:hypothetical protein
MISNATQPELLTLAATLAPGARRLGLPALSARCDAVDRGAAQAADAIARVEEAERARAGTMEAVRGAEATLDRRTVALAETLAALQKADVEGAGDLRFSLFPTTAGAVVAASGRAQVAPAAQLAARLRAQAAHPARVWVGAQVDALLPMLDGFAALVQDRDAARGGAATAATARRQAVEGLRDALAQLRAAVALEAGGESSEAYRQWLRGAETIG